MRLAQEHGASPQQEQHTGLSAMFRGASLRPTLSLALGFFLNWFAIVIFAVLGTSVLGGAGGTPGKGVDFSQRAAGAHHLQSRGLSGLCLPWLAR